MHDHPQSKNYRIPLRCIRLMKYECFQPGQTIFRSGDEPDRFYLILKGNVNVFNPKPRHVIEKEKSWLSYLNSKREHVPIDYSAELGQSNGKTPVLKETREISFDIAAQMHFEFQDQKAQEIQEQATTYAKQKTRKNLFKVDLDDDTSEESVSLDLKVDTENSDANSSANKSFTQAVEEDNDSSSNSSNSSSSSSESKERSGKRQNQRVSTLIETASKVSKMIGGIQVRNIEDIKEYFEEDIFTLLYERTLTAGTLIGELGLLSRRPRARTLICKDVCELVSFGREGYYDLITLISENKVSDNFELVKRSLFPNLTIKSHLALLGIMKLQKHCKGDYIYKVGAPGDKVYLIKEGEVAFEREIKYHAKSANLLGEKELLADIKSQEMERAYKAAFKKKTIKENISYLTEGQYFGEEDYFMSQRRSVNAVCHSARAKIYTINSSDLMSFAREFSGTVGLLRQRMHQKNEWRLKQVERIETTRELLKQQTSSTNQSLSPKGRAENNNLEAPQIFLTQNNTPINQEERKPTQVAGSFPKKKAALSEKRLRLSQEGGIGLHAVLRAKRADLNPKSPTIPRPINNERIKEIAQSNEKMLKQKLNLRDTSPFFDRSGFPVVSVFTEKFLRGLRPRRRIRDSSQLSPDRSGSFPKMSESELVEYYMKKKNIQKTAHIFFQTEVATIDTDGSGQADLTSTSKKKIERAGNVHMSFLTQYRKLKAKMPPSMSSRNSLEKLTQASPFSSRVHSPFSSRVPSPNGSFYIQAKNNRAGVKEMKRDESPRRTPSSILLSRPTSYRPSSSWVKLKRSSSVSKQRNTKTAGPPTERKRTPSAQIEQNAVPFYRRYKTSGKIVPDNYQPKILYNH